MPSSPTVGRKLRLFRGDRGGHSRQAPCSARTWIHCLYGVIAVLLFAIVLLSRSREDPRLRQVGCGAAEDTLHSRVELPQVVEKETAADGKRPKVLAFVGIQTGFTSAERRRALRETWLPSTPEGITRLEEETGLVFRFVIGTTPDRKAAEELEKEVETYRDFLRIDNVEDYANLPHKTLAYFKAAHMLYDADFYVKIDDDIYLRPDRLSLLLKRKRDTPRLYLGCMKRGSVITEPQYKWFEPLGWLLGNEYFMHAWGPIYALSQDIVADMSNVRNDSLRLFSNEDVTIGSWMLAFNAHYEDDRSLCQAECQVDSVAVWDIPNCSGLCHPEKKLVLLHQYDVCSKTPTVHKD